MEQFSPAMIEFEASSITKNIVIEGMRIVVSPVHYY
jgi:hypothetical protein